MIRRLPALFRWILGPPRPAGSPPIRNPLRLASFWLLVATVVSYLAQLVPIPGVFLMFLGGPFLVGFLGQAALVALFIESVSGRTSRYLALIPVSVYALYYVWFAFDRASDLAARARVAAGLSSLAQFDPTTESLVSDDAVFIAQNYDIEVVYRRVAPSAASQKTSAAHASASVTAPNAPAATAPNATAATAPNAMTATASSATTAAAAASNATATPSTPAPAQATTLGYRLITGPLCDTLRRSRFPHSTQIDIAPWTFNPQDGWSRNGPKLCVVGTPEEPPLRPYLITHDRSGDRAHGGADTGASFHVESDGQAPKDLEVHYAERLSWLPLPYAGCALNDAAPSWACMHGFLRIPQGLNDGPYGTEQMQAEGRLALAIGLKRRGSSLVVAGRNAALVRARVDELVAAATAEATAAATQARTQGSMPEPATTGSTATDTTQARTQGAKPESASADPLAPTPPHTPARPAFDPVAAIQHQLDDPAADAGNPPNVLSPATRNAVMAAKDRWTPQAERLATTFAALARERPAGGMTHLLAMALDSLPPAAYRGLSDNAVDQLSRQLQQRPLQWGGLFYARLSDAGPRTLPFYRQHLAGSRHGAAGPETAEALCRLRDRDPATLAELRSRYLLNLSRTQPTPAGARRLSSFFEALLAAGDTAFLHAHAPQLGNPQLQDWFDRLLSGQAQGPGGPNNCRSIVATTEPVPPTWESLDALHNDN